MNNINMKISQIITGNICKEIITKVPYQSALLNLYSQRDRKIKNQCIGYIQDIVQNIKQINYAQHEQNEKIQDVEFEHPIVKRLGSRLSILRKKKQQRKSLPRKTKKNSSSQSTISKKSGLIKLSEQQIQDLQYEKFIQMLRKRKQKYNEAMEEFQKKQEQLKIMKNKCSQACITNFEGKIIKIDRKQKRDTANSLDKAKIKPLITIKQPIFQELSSSRKESSNISQQYIDFLKVCPNNRMQKFTFGQNQKFRSIFNIIESKKCIDIVKRNRRIK